MKKTSKHHRIRVLPMKPCGVTTAAKLKQYTNVLRQRKREQPQPHKVSGRTLEKCMQITRRVARVHPQQREDRPLSAVASMPVSRKRKRVQRMLAALDGLEQDVPEEAVALSQCKTFAGLQSLREAAEGLVSCRATT